MSGMNTSIYLNEELIMEIDDQAEQNGVSRNALLKELIEKNSVIFCYRY